MTTTGDEDQEITIELNDDGGGVIIDGAGAGAAAGVPLSDDPQAGVEDMKRQIEAANQAAAAANERAQNETRARQDAERRAAISAEETKRANVVAGDSQYDSIVNALAAHERDLENLQVQKASALEKGDYEAVAKLDGQMGRVTAKIVSFESGKAHIEEQRKLAPTSQAQQPVPTQYEQNERFLAGLPSTSAEWIRAHPRFFSDAAFQSKVMAAAEYAEKVKGINHHSPDYFRFIENEVGLGDTTSPPPPPASSPVSTAGATVQGRTSAPAKAPVTVAAAPSRSVPDSNGQPSRQTTVRLTPQQREMARIMHPKLKPTDPDPEVVYARNLAALRAEGRIGT